MSISNDLNLTTCDRDPIHTIGHVQGNNYWFCFGSVDNKVIGLSDNIKENFSRIEVIPRRTGLEDLFNNVSLSAINLAMKTEFWQRNKFTFVDEIVFADHSFEGYIYQLQGAFGLELRNRTETEIVSLDLKLNEFSNFLTDCDSLEAAGKALAHFVRRCTGYDRVMVYRFLPNWDGEVIAEDKTAAMHSYLYHRFPSTDIPKPARDLYLQNRVRLISHRDSGSSPIRVYDNTKGHLLDLSMSKARAVPHVHLEYLKNMNVKASLSIAIIQNNNLWGLIACHAEREQSVTHKVLNICELASQFFSQKALYLENKIRQSNEIDFQNSLFNVCRSVFQRADPIKSLLGQQNELLRTFRAQGIAWYNEKASDMIGLCPPQEILKEINQWLLEVMDKEKTDVLAITDLVHKSGGRWENLKSYCSGVLAIRTDKPVASTLILFRSEALKEITWGGDPRKILDGRQYSGPINPRKSFESWYESTSGRSLEWQSYEIQGLQFIKELIFDSLAQKEHLLVEVSQMLGKKDPT